MIDLDLGQLGIEGQGRRSKVKVKHVFTWPLPCFRVKVKGRGQGQRSGSRSKVEVKVKGQVKVKFWRAAVDNRGSALPSAAKSNKSHYQFKVFVCVSVISGRMRIIARMRSIGVLMIYYNKEKHFFSRVLNINEKKIAF